MKWDRIRRDLESGLRTFQFVGRFIAERTRVETSLAKVVYDTQKIRKKIDDRYRELGERIFELRDEKNPTDNAVVRDMIAELATLKEELDVYMTRAQELGGSADLEEAETENSGEPAPDPGDAPEK